MDGVFKMVCLELLRELNRYRLTSLLLQQCYGNGSENNKLIAHRPMPQQQMNLGPPISQGYSSCKSRRVYVSSLLLAQNCFGMYRM